MVKKAFVESVRHVKSVALPLKHFEVKRMSKNLLVIWLSWAQEFCPAARNFANWVIIYLFGIDFSRKWKYMVNNEIILKKFFEKMKLWLLNTSFIFWIDMDILDIVNKILIELLGLKWIKLTFIFIYLFLSHQYQWNKQYSNCYQIKYHIKYNFQCVFTLDRKWSFYQISIMDSFIDTQTVFELLLLKWIKMTFIFIYLFIHYQYHCIKQNYHCYQMEYYLKYHLNYVFVLDRKWSFDKISIINVLIYSQTPIQLLLLIWIKMTFILIYLIILHQYHWNKQHYHCYQMEYYQKYHLNYAFVVDVQWSFDKMSKIQRMFNTQVVIELSRLKWIKLCQKLIDLFISYQYHQNKSDYNCYQMEYSIQYHVNQVFTLDIQWTFDWILTMDNTQPVIQLQRLKWIKLTEKLIYSIMFNKYCYNNKQYMYFQMKYNAKYYSKYMFAIKDKFWRFDTIAIV